MAGYIGPAPVPQATQNREAFTATSGQTSFATAGYTPQFIDVYLNGVKLAAADYTATNGSDVVLASGAASGDILEVVAFSAFTVADQAFTGTTTAANLTVTGAFTSQGIDDNADATAITIDSSENVGIGTSSPTTKLQSKSGSISTPTNNAGLIANASASFVVDHGNDYGIYTGYVNSTNDAVGIAATRTLGGALPLSLQPFGGNVGIGTSSPSSPLQIQSSNNQIRLVDSQNTSMYCVIETISDAGLSFNADVGGAAVSSRIQFNVDNSEKMRIDNDGNVGVGTSSPSGASGKTLAINGGSGQTRLALKNTSTGDASGDGFQISIGTDGSAGIEQRENNYMAFLTNATERMRIDSSGNLLVGKTSSNSDVVGVEAAQDGHVYVTVNNTLPFYINRQSGAEMLRFASNGSTVGSIGASGGEVYIGNADTGLKFNSGNDYIQPFNVTGGSGRDNAIDIGNSGNRFKDLYLSGGVYLGGTGSANKLDDYEEGTYNVTLVPQYGTITMSSARDLAKYVKIGSLVYVSGQVRLSSVSGASGSHVTFSLPFANSSGSELSSHHWNSVVVYNFGYTNRDQGLWLFDNNSSARFLDSNYNYIPPSAFSGDEEIIFSFTYRTDA